MITPKHEDDERDGYHLPAHSAEQQPRVDARKPRGARSMRYPPAVAVAGVLSRLTNRPASTQLLSFDILVSSATGATTHT